MIFFSDSKDETLATAYVEAELEYKETLAHAPSAALVQFADADGHELEYAFQLLGMKDNGLRRVIFCGDQARFLFLNWGKGKTTKAETENPILESGHLSVVVRFQNDHQTNINVDGWPLPKDWKSNLAWICGLLERDSLVRSYGVVYKGKVRTSRYFEFTDDYPRWTRGK